MPANPATAPTIRTKIGTIRRGPTGSAAVKTAAAATPDGCFDGTVVVVGTVVRAGTIVVVGTVVRAGTVVVIGTVVVVGTVVVIGTVVRAGTVVVVGTV